MPWGKQAGCFQENDRGIRTVRGRRLAKLAAYIDVRNGQNGIARKEREMKQLSPKNQRWLKGFHSLIACMWVGAALVLIVKQFFVNPSNSGELYGIASTMDFIDIVIIIPGAIGVLLSGLIYSVWTNWGWFKHRWIIVKWIICLYGVIFGTYPLGPWMSSLARLSEEKGLAALADPTYLHNRTMLYAFGTFQAATLVFAVFVTALKSWKQKARVYSPADD